MRHPRDFDKPLASVVAKLPTSVRPIMVFASFIAAPVSIGVLFAVMGIYSLATDHAQLFKATLLGVALAPLAEMSKLITRRRRPETLYAKSMRFKTYSFPSGHSYISALVFGFLAVLAWSALPFGSIFSLALVALAFTVGVSRVYLGAHFPSDVLAGWLLGAIMLIFWIKVGL